MTTFYVGQIVRINCEGSVVNGYETRIASGIELIRDDEDGDYYGYQVDIPLDEEDCPKYPGELAAFEPHELEPITNLDNTATTWDAMPCDRNGKFRVVPA